MAQHSTNHNKLAKKLRRLAGRAVADYAMIEDGDRIMACLSGGKDSYTLLDVLLALQPQRAGSVRGGCRQSGSEAAELPGARAAHLLGGPRHRVPRGGGRHLRHRQGAHAGRQNLLPRCARACASGVLYNFATRIGATKIALGHHADDAVETLFLNMFHGGRLKAMPPKLVSDDGRHVVIRPLYYLRERDIACWSRYQQHPIIPCDLCGSQDNLQRAALKAMLAEWDAAQPGRVDSIARALRHVTPSHLADSALMDFKALQRRVEALPIKDLTGRAAGG